MDEKQRMTLIREGNKLFNSGNISQAQQYFLKANYSGGLLRVADHLFYEEKKPLNALSLYMKCGQKERVEEIYKRMAFALGKLIQKDKAADEIKVQALDNKVESEIIDGLKQNSKENN